MTDSNAIKNEEYPMRTILTAATLGLTVYLISSSAFADEQTRHVSAFNSINTQSACKITIEVGKTQSITLNHLNTDDFDLSYEGAGSLTANGKVRHLRIRSEGVGSIDMKDVAANDVEVKGEGVGTINVTALDKLNASLQGIGSLTYFGHPKTISKAVQGIGSIKAGD